MGDVISLIKAGKYNRAFNLLRRKKLSAEEMKLAIVSKLLLGDLDTRRLGKLKPGDEGAKAEKSVYLRYMEKKWTQEDISERERSNVLLAVIRAWLEASEEKYERCLMILDSLRDRLDQEGEIEKFLVAKLRMLVHYKHSNIEDLETLFSKWKSVLAEWKNYTEIALISSWIAELLIERGQLEDARSLISHALPLAQKEGASRLVSRLKELKDKTILEVKKCPSCGAYIMVPRMNWCPKCGSKLKYYVTINPIKWVSKFSRK